MTKCHSCDQTGGTTKPYRIKLTSTGEWTRAEYCGECAMFAERNWPGDIEEVEPLYDPDAYEAARAETADDGEATALLLSR